MKRIIILDETDGLSRKGAFMKRLAKNRGLDYVTSIEEFLEFMKNVEDEE